MYPIYMEEKMSTHMWPNWVLQFLIGVTKVSFNLDNNHIYEQDMMDEITIMW